MSSLSPPMAAEMLGQSLHSGGQAADEEHDLVRVLAPHFPLTVDHADGPQVSPVSRVAE